MLRGLFFLCYISIRLKKFQNISRFNSSFCRWEWNSPWNIFHIFHFASIVSVAVSQDDPLCAKIKNKPPGGPDIPVRLQIEQGDTFEIKCKFCSDDRHEPVNWYFKELHVQAAPHGDYKEFDGPETEITADPFTFDEFNRIFLQKDNSLLVRKFNGEKISKHSQSKTPFFLHTQSI